MRRAPESAPETTIVGGTVGVTQVAGEPFSTGVHTLTAGGKWLRRIAPSILDDHSRLLCHMQWYVSESAEDLVHRLPRLNPAVTFFEDCQTIGRTP
jgi:hypothetical protein